MSQPQKEPGSLRLAFSPFTHHSLPTCQPPHFRLLACLLSSAKTLAARRLRPCVARRPRAYGRPTASLCLPQVATPTPHQPKRSPKLQDIHPPPRSGQDLCVASVGILRLQLVSAKHCASWSSRRSYCLVHSPPADIRCRHRANMPQQDAAMRR
jgi:hypothetical protein